jgi:hypothetical protein
LDKVSLLTGLVHDVIATNQATKVVRAVDAGDITGVSVRTKNSKGITNTQSPAIGAGLMRRAVDFAVL